MVPVNLLAGPATPDPAADPAAVPDVINELVCSTRGCRAPGTWGLLWNNPKLHTPQRRKVWLACDEHREQLEQYLGARSFLRATVPVAELEIADDAERPAGGPGAS